MRTGNKKRICHPQAMVSGHAATLCLDDFAHLGGAGEGNLVHVQVGGEGGPGSLPEPVHHVDHAYIRGKYQCKKDFFCRNILILFNMF